jgi:hypothetical protein
VLMSVELLQRGSEEGVQSSIMVITNKLQSA